MNIDDVQIFDGDLPSALALHYLRAGSTISVDIETNGLDPKGSKIKTVQLLHQDPSGKKARPVILRVKEGTPPHNLCDLVRATEISKLFHHAPFDLRFMYHHWGVSASNVKCTKVAAKLLKLPSKSYGPLVKSLLGVEIEKDQDVRMSGWDGPLSDAQIKYAVEDVLHLQPLLYAIQKDLDWKEMRLLRALWNHIPARVALEVDHGLTDIYAYK